MSDVAALQVPVHWAEAVAIVEELCALLVRGDAGVWIPESRDVLITAHGTVMVRLGAEGTSDIDDLGRMLHDLLDPAATPMPIRLFNAQSIGSGKFPTVSAYADALAYYGRPGRTEMIQALYLRCLEMPDPESRPAVPKVEEPEPPEIPVPVPVRRRWTKAAAVGFMCATIATTAVWIWGLDSDVSASVAVIRKAVSAAASATAEQVGLLKSPVPPPEASAKTPSPSRRDTGRQRARQPQPRQDVVATASATQAPLLPAPQLTPPAPEARPATIEGGLATPPPVAALLPPSTALVIDPVVYSSESQEVQPPVMIYPQLPPVPPPSPDAPGANTMQLLIDESGTVQEAKLTSRPVRLTDGSMLPAAKTWRFRPARKDGRPVKYRLALSWLVTPP